MIFLSLGPLLSGCGESSPTNRQQGNPLRAPNPTALLNRIVSDHEKCRDVSFIRPVDAVTCDLAGVSATYAALPQSKSNKAFDAFLADLEGPMMRHITNGSHEDPRTDWVVLTAQTFDLAVERAAILTGVHIKMNTEVKLPKKLFSWLLPFTQPAEFERRWIALRDADCRIYKVPNCAALLDDAVRKAYDLQMDSAYLHETPDSNAAWAEWVRCSTNGVSKCLRTGWLIHDRGFQRAMHEFAGEPRTDFLADGEVGPLDGELIEALSGVDGKRRRLPDGSYLFPGCYHFDCTMKGAVILSPNTKVIAAAMITQADVDRKSNPPSRRLLVDVFVRDADAPRPWRRALEDWAGTMADEWRKTQDVFGFKAAGTDSRVWLVSSTGKLTQLNS